MLGQDLMPFLENEALHAIRRAFALNEKVAVLFSGGKDSCLLLSLVEQVAIEREAPYEILHIDTDRNFSEIIEHRDRVAKILKRPLVVGKVIENPEIGLNRSQASALNQVIQEKGYGVLFGGGRRAEDKARSKETFFSLRQSGWEPEQSLAEIWPWLGLGKRAGQHFRVFPLNNWTELDVWQFIAERSIVVPALYFSHPRECTDEAGTKKIQNVRFRTIGDQTNSFPILSSAKTALEIFEETKGLKEKERALRLDDRFSQYSMEIRKKEGYF